MGYQYKNKMYTIGLMYPKKFNLLNTSTCTRTSRVKRITFIK
jgi:hypothetical protein